ncbi:MAG TPA: NAD(P)H-dependent oxidoreductase [Flavobacterium sp.]|nr:NAD(P)H-dependent oxidoreductase [Flavobacterium sp.]
MNTFLENQNWRYAIKKYDTSRKVSVEDLEFLKEAIRYSPSGFGLQPYRVLIIENPELREKLKLAAPYNPQVVEASQLIVFANETHLGDTHVDSYINNISKTRNIPAENLAGFSNAMKTNFAGMEVENKNIWASKQTYLALANLISAAAELKIDVSPMEGFDVEGFNEILGLKEKGLNAAVIAAIGYRHAEDATQHYIKVRKPNEELFINL